MTQDAITPAQMFAARQLLRLTRKALAKRTSTRDQSVQEFEVQGLVCADLDLQTVREALEAAGVEFVAKKGGGAGVRLRKGNAAEK